MTSTLMPKPAGYITILPEPTKLYVSAEFAMNENVSTLQFESPEINQDAIYFLVISIYGKGPFVLYIA